MGECGSTRKPGHCSFLPECDNLLQKDDWEGLVVLTRQVSKGHAYKLNSQSTSPFLRAEGPWSGGQRTGLGLHGAKSSGLLPRALKLVLF